MNIIIFLLHNYLNKDTNMVIANIFKIKLELVLCGQTYANGCGDWICGFGCNIGVVASVIAELWAFHDHPFFYR